jgi:hypothetical protein
MAKQRRVQRLRDMVDQIERLPESPERDRLLSEVRSRAVDVDTGVSPRAMLPLRETPPPPVLPRPAKRDNARFIRRVVPRTPAPAVESAHHPSPAGQSMPPERSFLLNDYLSLEDAPSLPDILVRGNLAAPPWTFGLRG